MKFNNLNSALLLLIFVFYGCMKTEEETYLEYKGDQLEKGINQDTLFKGLYFGMPKKVFREYCFDRNLEKEFWQGGRKNLTWVETDLSGLVYPAAINFYPEFHNDSISEMNASIYYKDSEVRKPLDKDSLLLDVINLLENWYEGKTFKIKSPFFYKDDIYVHQKGNCRITIYPDLSGNMINLWYVDLNVNGNE